MLRLAVGAIAPPPGGGGDARLRRNWRRSGGGRASRAAPWPRPRIAASACGTRLETAMVRKSTSFRSSRPGTRERAPVEEAVARIAALLDRAVAEQRAEHRRAFRRRRRAAPRPRRRPAPRSRRSAAAARRRSAVLASTGMSRAISTARASGEARKAAIAAGSSRFSERRSRGLPMKPRPSSIRGSAP